MQSEHTNRLGVFYALQPFPELSPNRIKFGWTGNLSKRLTAHRCAAPTARVFASWPCPSDYEHLLVKLVVRRQRDCERVGRETYDVGDLVGMYRRIERWLSELRTAGLVQKSMHKDFLRARPQSSKSLRRIRPTRTISDPTADAAITNVDEPAVIETGHVARRPSNRRSRRELLDEYWAKNPLTPVEEAFLDFYAPISVPEQGTNLPRTSHHTH